MRWGRITALLLLATPVLGDPPMAVACLPSGDGYLRARVAGALEAHIDWPNSGTRCQGETKITPAGVRLSFERLAGGGTNEDLLFVFGLTGVRQGQPAREIGVNLTLFAHAQNRVFGTQGDTRCTVDALTQRPLQGARGARGAPGAAAAPGAPGTAYRIEARGFCTQPAHAVRGDGAVLVSTFEFAGRVDYDSAAAPDDAAVHDAAPPAN